MSFSEIIKDDRSYISCNIMKELGAINAFSRKSGGVSRGKIEGLNFGFRVGDNPMSVLNNYELLGRDFGLDTHRMVCARQQHTDNIRIVTDKDCGKGVIVVDSDITDTDGLVTNVLNIPLIVFTADCVSLLFFDPVKKVVAATHAGWRGTVKEIGKKTIEIMASHFGCDEKDIIAAIGPSIGPCCFEVGEDTAKMFDKKYHLSNKGEKVHIDLWQKNKDDMLKMGLKPENIFISGECSICNADKYYSYRTHKDHTGRQIAMIALT